MSSIRFFDHGMLLVLKTCFVAIVYRPQVIRVFSKVSDGDLSISAVKGRIKPEITSPIDSATTVSFSC
jgi:hypothetical protein